MSSEIDRNHFEFVGQNATTVALIPVCCAEAPKIQNEKNRIIQEHTNLRGSANCLHPREATHSHYV